ncbi:MAG: hypothetical protein WA705_02375 [Candidatus Ozemobacteraceae bacterium]
MTNFLKRLGLPLLGVCLLTGTAFSRSLPTTISSDGDPLKDAGIVVCSPMTGSKGGFLGNLLGKIAGLPIMTKIQDIGFLANAMSVDAFQVQAPDSKSFVQNTVLPYLNASKEMEDSLKLRKSARQIKFQTFTEMLKKVDTLTPEQKKAILDFISQQAGSPMIVLDKSPLPKFLPTPGPCMMPIGVERIDPKSEKRLGLDTSAICILDIPGLFSVKDALDNDTLDVVLCHENAHGIMFDMYGKLFGEIKRPSTNGHDAPYITDQGLGYTEGWAEAFEAVYGPANPKFAEKDRKKYNISEFLYARQNPIRRDRYVWARYQGKKTGITKNGLQLMSTEGVVAGQFYDLLTSKSINAPFEKSVTAMLMQAPKSFSEFVKAFVQIFPEDKKVVYRILLEGTNYVIMSKDASPLYQKYYETKLQYVQKKLSKEEHLKAKQAFVSFKEDLFKKAMDGADIFANVGPDLWFSGSVKLEAKSQAVDAKEKMLAKIGEKKPEVWDFNLNLNTITAKMLVTLGIEEADADKIIAERQNSGFFSGDPLKILAEKLGAEKYRKVVEKAALKTYDPNPTTPAAKLAVLWPEDIEKIISGQ